MHILNLYAQPRDFLLDKFSLTPLDNRTSCQSIESEMLFGEAPPDRPPTWRAPPDYRGSFTILSTCLITLTLCIWTSLHLNIPEHYRGPIRSKWDPRSWITKQFLRKVFWLMIGLLAPEMVCNPTSRFGSVCSTVFLYRSHSLLGLNGAKPVVSIEKFNLSWTATSQSPLRNGHQLLLKRVMVLGTIRSYPIKSIHLGQRTFTNQTM